MNQEKRNADQNKHSSIWNRFAKLNSILNYDFCPNVNQYVYWLKQPIGWVVCGAAFSAIVGFLIGPQGFVLMWSFLALMAIGAFWPWLSMKRITCQLTFDRSRIDENGRATAIIEVTNNWPVPVFGLMVEGEFLLDILDEDDEVAVALQRVPGWSVSRFSWSFIPRQRGELPRGIPNLTNGFPFGLYKTKKTIAIKRQSIVWPEAKPLRGVPGIEGSQFNIAGMMSDRSGRDGDVIGVRQYRQDDSLKHIHWAKSASLGRLIVQERQTCMQRPVEVIVDLSANAHRGNGSQGSFEWSIRVAATVCSTLHRHQAQLNLTCIGLPSNLPFQVSNTKGLGPVLDFLAKLPLLEEVKLAESIRECQKERTGTQAKRFLICTSESALRSTRGTQLIELNVTAFEECDLRTPSKSSHANVKTKIQILSPELARNQLTTGWEGNVCNEV